jgi:hypothetical protein
MPSSSPVSSHRHPRWRGVLLWTDQGLLACLFLFAGGAKLAMPVATLAQATHLPGAFMRFIAVAELVGALGLVLPGLLRIKPGLTVLAAVGLMVIMVGATSLTVVTQGVAPASFPFVVGALLLVIIRGRRQGVPLRESALLRRTRAGLA